VVLLISCGSDAQLDEAVLPQPAGTVAPAPVAQECDDAEEKLDSTRTYSPDPTPGASVQRIKERGRLIVGVSGDTLLFGARNPLNGEIEGFDVDLLKQVAIAIFGTGGEQKIEYRVITYAERLPRLESGDVDLVAHTMTVNCRRWLRIAFSSVYFDAGQKLLVRKESRIASLDELAAAKLTLCAPEGSTNIELVEDGQYEENGLRLVGVSDISDCLVGIQQGTFDAATSDDTVLAGFVAQDPNLKVVGDRLSDEPYGIGVAAEQIDLVRFINAELDEMRADGRWAAIYQRWLVDTGALAGPVPTPPAATYGRDDG
jgi:polar amino acid transport system substrate-binding protein